MSNLKAPPVHRIIVAQLVATALIAVFFLVLLNAMAAYSTLVGGLVSVFANGFFALLAFRYRGARNAEKVVKSFMQGEMGKIMITLVSFALVFTLFTAVNEVAMIGGFLVAQFTGIMMSGLINYSPDSYNS